MEILEKIRGPQDLKRLSLQELNELANEIRQRIIEVVSKNGGHLAASLGAVELAIAIHCVFNSPEDKIIWDVGHQAYAHKLLCGRAATFDSLRLPGGISGFPKRKESPHDAFDTGHASTSISAALGFAKARDILKLDYSVIAVIGDGALSGGMSFEALNNAGQDGTNLIVVLNDNSMSINPSVGALSAHISKLRTDPKYSRMKTDLEQTLKHMPVLGKPVKRIMEKLKDSIKYLVLPGMLFEELGFTYLGPIDGHNIATLQSVLRDAKKLGGPVLVHAVTQKGKGYPPAERSPEMFHGISPIKAAEDDSETKNGGSAPTYSRVFGNTLVKLARTDCSIVAITAAMTDGTGLSKFKELYPQRFFDVGIAEQHAVTFAAGMAASGLRPVVAIYSTFLQRAYDQIVHDVCLQELPVTFCIDRAGIVGEDGATHQGAFDISYLRHIPNMVLMAPKDENELQHMVTTAVSLGKPAAVRYPRGEGFGVKLDEDLKTIQVGKAELLRSGHDVAIIALGSLVYPALDAAEILSKMGISAAVVNARFVKPLDEKLIVELANRTNCIVTVEENVVQGGFGSAVLECLTRHNLTRVATACLGLPDEFIEHGPRSLLLHKAGLDAEGIAERVQSLFGSNFPQAKVRNAPYQHVGTQRM